MGKHFTVQDGNLFIFTTGGDTLLDVTRFPHGLNLFEADAAWRISPWAAVSENVYYKSVERARIILQLNGYSEVHIPSKVLEKYFTDGVEAWVESVLRRETVLSVEAEDG